ncbi:MAG TPA: Holliday junction resolvase RuvX [Lachnospiraceae bacterium]|nr:Holliday junction resolvase RuvX [Lachnospiraceae bacterium]
MRIMGLDYGSKTVGVAVSDTLMYTAQGVEIIRRERENKLRRTYARLEELVKEYDVGRIVLGFPKNMNNTEGERCARVKEFGSNVKRRTGLPVVLWDERLTTVAAERSMEETGVRDRKRFVDEIAAMFILQGYLDSQRK